MFSFFYECEEKYQNMMDFAPHLIASVNDDGQIIDCNSRISEILGYSKEEVIGLSILDFIHPSYHARAISSWNDCIPNHILRNDQLIMIHKDGSEVNVSIKLTGLKDDNLDRNSSIWVIEETKTGSKEKNRYKRNVQMLRFIWIY